MSKDYTVKENETVLDACLANGIDVPRLCACPGLSNVGACRMCVVEIKGERKPVPSCTYPVRNGLVVKTDTERLEKYRLQILELLFTERNHFCMFCEASGDCELQKLAYRYQMDHVGYAYKYPKLDVDTLSELLIFDHNRCILCGRCVRACDEVAASRTLGFNKRGWETKVAADLQQSLGKSSCRLCGACMQSCPTGAITNRVSYYRGTRDTCIEAETTCPGCSIGCGLNVLVKDNNINRIESPNLTGSINGSLCRIGRFDLLKTRPNRITVPLVRNGHGELKESTWEETLSAIAGKISGKKTAGIVSSRLPVETLGVFRKFIKNAAGGGAIDTTDGGIYRAISSGMKKTDGLFNEEGTVKNIPDADYILLVGADPQVTNPVVSTVIRRTVNKTKAKLAIINEKADVLPLWSYLWLNPKKGNEALIIKCIIKTIVNKKWNKAGLDHAMESELKTIDLETAAQKSEVSKDDLEIIAREYSQAKKPFIIYGEKLLSSDVNAVSGLATLAAVTGNSKGIMSLKPAANSRGAWEMGLAEGIMVKPECLYLLLGDDTTDKNLLKQIEGLDYLVVQTSYRSPAVEKADVVLPSPIWAERSGSYITLDGRSVKAQRVLKPVDGIKQDEEILTMIAEKLGRKIN
jgi:formate dehydrogenase major subunit